jgi:hypothetical protein
MAKKSKTKNFFGLLAFLFALIPHPNPLIDSDARKKYRQKYPNQAYIWKDASPKLLMIAFILASIFALIIFLQL